MNDDIVLSDAEARVLCALSQQYRSIGRLARDLGTTVQTLDKLAWRPRRGIRPFTVAKVRVGLRRLAAEHLRTVHIHEAMQ